MKITVNNIFNNCHRLLTHDCNRLFNKIEEFVIFVNQHKPVQFSHRETNPESGGGAAILINKELDPEEINIKEYGEEAVAMSIKLNGVESAIASWYNAPSRNGINHNLLKWIDSKYKHYLIVGDLNCHCSPWSKKTNYAGDSLTEFLDSNRSAILNDPRQTTSYWKSGDKSSNSIIDLFIGSEFFIKNMISSKVYPVSVLDVFQDLHYHVPVICTFGAKKEKVIITNNEAYDYTTADWNELRLSLDALAPTIEICKSAMGLAFEVTRAYNVAVESAVKKITQEKKTNRVTNLPPNLVKLMRIKNYWHRRYRRTKTGYCKRNFYALKEAFKRKLSAHQSKKMKKFMKGLGKAPLSTKPLWSRINRTRNLRNNSGIPTLKKEGKFYTTDKEKAQVFGERMRETFSENTNPNQFDDKFKKDIDEYIHDKNFEALYKDKNIKKLKMKELKYALAKINKKTSLDAQGISNLVLKKTPLMFRKVLLLLFNKCLEENFLPAEWKESIIKMIDKKADDKSNPKNRRPISITSCIMRLFERLILRRLQSHLDKEKILVTSQSGFRKNRSTRDNLVYLVQKSKESFNRGRNVLAIFFDIEAAFDKVWHNGLIYKLIQARVPYYIVRFMITFLENRRFRIKINNEYSEWIIILCGVPQGAVLSPTLFAIYINDSPNRSLKNSEQTLLFADDTAYMLFFKKKTQAITNRVNKFLNDLSMWAKKWRVTLAPHKCQHIVISNLKTCPVFELWLNGLKIESAEEVRFLGLRIDKRMSFKYQVDYLKKACSERLNILKIISHKSWHLNEKILKEIYHSLVRSLLEYTSFIYQMLIDDLKKKVDSIQNRALRIIYKKERQFGNVALHKLAEKKALAVRLRELKEKYLMKNLLTNNPIITSLRKEFKSLRGARELKHKTILCDIEWLDDSLLDDNNSDEE